MFRYMNVKSDILILFILLTIITIGFIMNLLTVDEYYF